VEGLTGKIGVFGGTFDPVHNGHLVKAEQALALLGLDRVIFMVAGDPWMKREAMQAVTPARHRLRMVELAVAQFPAFSSDDREVFRMGPTYTVDSLRELATENEGAELFLLLGSDALGSMDRWRDPKRVLEMARVVVLERPMTGGTGDGAEALLDGILPGAGARALVLAADPVAVSSSDVRQRVGSGEPVSEWVPPGVAEYIDRYGLYGSQ
jgi:nicotinate-nucleotide adenylyltransferase